MHHVPSAVQVGVYHRFPALDAVVQRPLRELPAGVIDEHVYASEMQPRHVDQLFHLLGLTDRHGLHQHVRAAEPA